MVLGGIMVIRPKRFVAIAIIATVLLGIGFYLEREYEGDEVAQESVVVLAGILAAASWLTERRLLSKQAGPKRDDPQT
jgi:hypothetical protein